MKLKKGWRKVPEAKKRFHEFKGFYSDFSSLQFEHVQVWQSVFCPFIFSGVKASPSLLEDVVSVTWCRSAGGGACTRHEAAGRRSAPGVSSSGRRRSTDRTPRTPRGRELQRNYRPTQPQSEWRLVTFIRSVLILTCTCTAWRGRCCQEPSPASSGASLWPSWRRRWRWRGWRSVAQWSDTWQDTGRVSVCVCEQRVTGSIPTMSFNTRV